MMPRKSVLISKTVVSVACVRGRGSQLTQLQTLTVVPRCSVKQLSPFLDMFRELREAGVIHGSMKTASRFGNRAWDRDGESHLIFFYTLSCSHYLPPLSFLQFQ